MATLDVAVIQLSPKADQRANLGRAASLLGEAGSRGARLAVLPEMFSLLVPPDQWRDSAEPAGGPVEDFLSRRAKALQLYIVGGSFIEIAEDGRLFNTCPVFAPDGSLLGRYRKMHLFWTDIKGATAYDERSYLSAGDSRLIIEIEGFAASVGICYDLRFPEFFRPSTSEPVDILFLGAAFMYETGRAHWETLVRARAIENLAYFAAAATVGTHYDIPGRSGRAVSTFGHSMVVSPWGKVLSCVDEGEGIALATVSTEAIRKARNSLAALQHIRSDLWRRT